MTLIGHALLALAGALLATLGISLFRNAAQDLDNNYSRGRTRTFGLAVLLASFFTSFIASTSFWFEEGFYSLPLTIGSVALWLSGALIGYRFFTKKPSVKYLSLAATIVLVLWWVMRDGGIRGADEGFLLIGLVAWVLASLWLELRGKGSRWDNGVPHDGRSDSYQN
jgi:O-antigen/teichoic acid export membrane protein